MNSIRMRFRRGSGDKFVGDQLAYAIAGNRLTLDRIEGICVDHDRGGAPSEGCERTQIIDRGLAAEDRNISSCV